MSLYRRTIRPLLFSFDPETTHDALFNLMQLACIPGVSAALQRLYAVSDPRLVVDLLGLSFKNPVGLAAGFDKNCRAVGFLSALGFGHLEIGTITARSQPGNDRPRIFRFVGDQVLINRMGFPSAGAAIVAPRLQAAFQQSDRPILGANIGKTKAVPVDQANEDYLACFRLIRDYADYYVLNVSSPNTPDLRKLQEPKRLLGLYRAVQQENIENKPLLIKIAPDLNQAELSVIIDVAKEAGVSGIIATNTTFSRTGMSEATAEQGGMSGRLLHNQAVEVVRYLYNRTAGTIPIVGVGGIFSGPDALRMIEAGASLIQVYTGLIYEGPAIVKEINRYLLETITVRRIENITQLVGVSSGG